LYIKIYIKKKFLKIIIFNIIWNPGISLNFYIIIPKICLSVWPHFYSAPWHDRNSRSVSLEPVWPEECLSKNNFSEKWPLAKYPKMGYKTYIWYFPILWTGSLSIIKYLINKYNFIINFRTPLKILGTWVTTLIACNVFRNIFCFYSCNQYCIQSII
jgi:hypothetical protein